MVQKELSGRALAWILLAAEEDYLCLLPRLSMTATEEEKVENCLLLQESRRSVLQIFFQLLGKTRNFLSNLKNGKLTCRWPPIFFLKISHSFNFFTSGAF